MNGKQIKQVEKELKVVSIRQSLQENLQVAIERAQSGDRKFGVVLILVGLAGLILPILPGWVLIGLGIYTLWRGRK